MSLILIGKDVKVVMRKVETKVIYVCDRCGKEFDQSYCIMNVHLPQDLSVAGKEYHFCKQCYEEIHSLMKDKNKAPIDFSEIKGVYIPYNVPMWSLNDWSRAKTTIAKCTDGISISAKDINSNNIITTGTINNNDVTTCCCDNIRRD